MVLRSPWVRPVISKVWKYEKKKCTEQKLSTFVYQNLRFPKEAITKGIQGQVVVQFVVEKDGKISNPVIRKDIGGGCGEEVLRIIGLMNTMDEKWTPGRHAGKFVQTLYTLPVTFIHTGKH